MLGPKIGPLYYVCFLSFFISFSSFLVAKAVVYATAFAILWQAVVMLPEDMLAGNCNTYPVKGGFLQKTALTAKLTGSDRLII